MNTPRLSSLEENGGGELPDFEDPVFLSPPGVHPPSHTSPPRPASIKKLPAVETIAEEEEDNDVNDDHQQKPNGVGLLPNLTEGKKEEEEEEEVVPEPLPLPSTKDPPDIPRLVLRNLPFHQSTNNVQVFHNHDWRIVNLLLYDWFHVFLRTPTWMSLSLLLSIWTAALLIFAGAYVWFDYRNEQPKCYMGTGGDPIEFVGGFAFSLMTATTVGYTLPSGTNAFFEKCPSLQIIIYCQMVWSMMFYAFMFAFFYSRLAKSDNRGVQVVFSKQAIVSTTPTGQVRLQIRMYDVDARHPVVEAHVRLLAISKARPVPRPLRLLYPPDELGGTLFLSMPTVIAHHIDLYSELHPPGPRSALISASAIPRYGDAMGLLMRQADSTVSNREEVICPICGENYTTRAVWLRHVRFQQALERAGDYPVAGTHLSLPESALKAQWPAPAPVTQLSTLQDYFRRHVSEVICVVEGKDPMTSGSFMSLHSYRYEDLVWQERAEFRPCVQILKRTPQEENPDVHPFFEDRRTERVMVDLDLFNEVVTVRD